MVLDFGNPALVLFTRWYWKTMAFPGGMMIGTDSHTVNAGGLGMIAIGVAVPMPVM